MNITIEVEGLACYRVPGSDWQIVWDQGFPFGLCCVDAEFEVCGYPFTFARAFGSGEISYKFPDKVLSR